jgi:predicted extracellular nuclease
MNGFMRLAALALVLSCGLGAARAQCVNINAVDVAQTQNFDALASSGTANTLTLPGWQLLESGGGARDNELYAADAGSSNTGDTYSYGASGAAERALGTLRSGSLIPVFGACFTNNTGAAIEALDIAYAGEQWRLGTAGRSDRLDFQYSLDAGDVATGSWIDVDALDFATPDTATTGAKDGNDAAHRAALAAHVGGLTIANGATFWVRWNDADASGADDGLAVDDFALTARGSGGGGLPTLAIGDVSQAEGDAGSTDFVFFVSLSAPAPAGGVSFDIATADGTASAGSDYAARSLSAQGIPEGATSYTFAVTVNGDTATEPDETFFVNLSNIAGAIPGDAQGVGSLVNDDITLLPIHDIQGPGATSPYAGQAISTAGIVTGRKGNGFFVQAPDAEADGDDATSEGVFVYTGSAPPAAATVGNRVRVSGTVVEFQPSADPLQLPLTEIGSVTAIAPLSAGHDLPTAIPLSAALPAPDGAIDQLERYEGMRVTVPSLTVVAPTGGNTNEPNATGTSNGVFHGVVTGTPRPFREPGIEAPNPAPSGSSIPPLPRWDANPELIAVDSDAIGAAKLDVSVGAVITDLTGPLDYGFRRYTLLPQTVPAIAGPAPGAARLPGADEFTVAAYNLERFFDTVNDPAIGEPVLTATAFANRLNKASLAIRDYLHAPDILATVEVENLSTLQALADKINADAVAAGQPDPQYAAYLQEGNDVGGIDVGFLVKSAEVGAGLARVDVVNVTQLGKDTTWIDPGTQAPSLLNDRPPLQLDAVVHYADGRDFPVTVIAVHQRSLNDVDSEDPAGTTTRGDRVRQKRQKQAEFLAGQVQDLQAADNQRRIAVLGDFNAFDFNDGLVDAMGVATGAPTPDEQTAVPGDGVDLVNPDLLNLSSLEPADQRYSFVFGGNAQSLDHVLANQALLLATDGHALDHARINADFPETNRNDANSPSRLSDHDPAIAYFKAPPLRFADLSATATATPANVDVGATMTFAAGIANAGPDPASLPAVGFAFDAALPDLAVVAPDGWQCDAAVIEDARTSLACSTESLAAANDASFMLTAKAPADRIGQSVELAVQAASQTEDPDQGNDGATATVAVQSLVDLGVGLTASTGSTRPGGTIRFSVPVVSKGLAAAAQAKLAVNANLPARNALLLPMRGWRCVRDNAAATFQASCERTSTMAVGVSESFRLITIVPVRGAPASVDIDAEVSSAVPDRTPADNSAALSIAVH